MCECVDVWMCGCVMLAKKSRWEVVGIYDFDNIKVCKGFMDLL